MQITVRLILVFIIKSVTFTANIDDIQKMHETESEKFIAASDPDNLHLFLKCRLSAVCRAHEIQFSPQRKGDTHACVDCRHSQY